MSNQSSQRTAKLRTSTLQRIGVASGVISALIHLFNATGGLLMPSIPEMFYGDAVSVVFTFFLGLGVFQLVWAAILLRSRNRLLLSVGVLGFLGSIVIYLVSLATPLPFGVKQQTITTFSAFPLTTKVIEAVFVVSSLSLLRRR